MSARCLHCLILSCVLALVCYVLTPTSTFGQNVQYTNQAVDLGLRGTQGVNPATLGVEFQIPLGHYRGRAGLDVPVTLSYSSKVWGVEYQAYVPGPPPPHGGMQPFTIVTAEYADHSVAGWTSSVGFPVLDFLPGDRIYNPNGSPNTSGNCTAGCYKVDRMMVWMPDGSGHELRSTDQPRLTSQAAADNFYSIDGSRMRYQSSTATLFMPDGSRFLFPGQYIDRNGNKLTWNNGWQDTLGRQIPNPLPFGPGSTPSAPLEQSYSLPGVAGGSPINYTLKWLHLADVLTTPEPPRYIADSACPPEIGGNFNPKLFSSDHSNRTCIANAGVLFNPVVLSQIVLPTGQSYTFTYDIYGAINKVVLPTGAYEKYQYQTVSPVSSPTTFRWVYAQVNRGVSSRIVSASGSGTDEVQWQYSATGGNFVSMTAPAPESTRTERYHWVDGVSGWGYSADSSRAGRAYDERVYSASGQMLRRKLTEWVMTPSNASGNPSGTQVANRHARVVREIEFILDTGGPALAKTTTYGYNTDYQYEVGVDQTSVIEFDYVAVDLNTAQTLPISSINSIPNGTILRTQETDYLTHNINYRARNLLGLVTATRVKNASNSIVAQSFFNYDEPFYFLIGYSTVTGWADPATPYRGNVTTTGSWLSTTGTYLQTHAQYDQCGNLRHSWDARDTGLTNPSRISYSDNFSDGVPRNTYALPTIVTTAIPDPTGTYGSNVALTNSTVYDFNTGKVISTTDPNSKTTSYDYTDPLNRIRQVTLPNTGRLRYSYSSTPGDLYVQVLTDQDSLRSVETRQYFDGLGRSTRGFLYDGTPSTPWVVTDTYYDNLSRVNKVSNPYRVSVASAAVPVTCSVCLTTNYDALSRVLSITTADSAQVTTSYSASTTDTPRIVTTVTDQAGRQRRSLTDALGRFVRVDEPDKVTGNLGTISAPVQPTLYDYDVLGNLLHVTQGAQPQRVFTYDSLSRLTSASNPESGMVFYQYDNNGNLTQKTDARPLTITYQYDALNRSTTVNYSNTTVGNPDVPDITRHYDGATNGKGRVWYSYAGGNNTGGSNVEKTSIISYDSLGRPLIQRQEFKLEGSWASAYQVGRSYNLSGAVTSQTYPSGHTLTLNYDAAGRLGDKDSNNLALTGNLGDGVQRTYSRGLTYASAGQLTQEQFGTTTPVFNKRTFNSRQQLTEVFASTSGNDNSWNRGKITNSYGTTNNNGNLLSQQVFVPTNEQGTTSISWYQTYYYDPLNRLTGTYEWNSGGSILWGQFFIYDQWGNRTINQGNTSSVVNRKNYEVEWQKNRLKVPTGQAGTMTYDPVGNLTVDSYTGYGMPSTATYNAENRIISAQSGPDTFSYSYSADGSRVRRKILNAETWQIYGFDGELLAEYQAKAAPYIPSKEYAYRNGELLTTLSNGDAGRLSRFVYNLYYGALQTDPTATQLADKMNELATAGAQGQTPLSTKAAEIARSLFVQTNYESARSDTQYVTDLYYAYLHRAPDDSGLNWWSTNGGAGGPINRLNVLNAFEASGEFQTLVSTLYGNAASDNERVEHFVNNLYLAATGIWPTSTQLQQQRDRLNTSADIDLAHLQSESEAIGRELLAAQVTDFNISDAQFVTNLYEAFLQRGPDAGGLNFWTSLAGPNSSTKRQTVLSAFATCPPFRDLSSTLYRAVFWSVSDQLGTPRMLISKSGSLTGVKRHDYLPFGEEIGADVGARTTAPNDTHGYASNDGVRQQFTLKERDNETGLDYFEARYFPSVQGRFISPDLLSGTPGSPQSWNRYSYCINNPLKYVDPSGLLWYTKDRGDGHPEWHDGDPGKGYTRFTQYTYYGGAANGYVALDPYSNNFLTGFRSEEDATAFSNAMAYQTMLGRDPGHVVSQVDGTLEVAGYIGGATAAVRLGWLGVRGAAGTLASRRGAAVATEEVVGLFGKVSVDALEAAASNSGPTIQVVTRLTRLPQAGRALSVATGEGAEALANAARSTGQLYRADIPKALLDQMVRSGLAQKSTTQMVGSSATATEYAFLPQASRFITRFFKE